MRRYWVLHDWLKKEQEESEFLIFISNVNTYNLSHDKTVFLPFLSFK